MFHFSIFGFRVSVHWMFWLLSAFIGGGMYARTPDQIARLVLIMALIFVSILAHELGHAWVGRKFGAFPSIQLHGLGGLTYLPGTSFTRVQNILVVAAGPGMSLAMAFLFALIDRAIGYQGTIIGAALGFGIVANIFWTILNMLPIQPMDGGQILRSVLGPSRIRITCWIGAACAAACAVYGLLTGWLFLALFMAYFAYLNFTDSRAEGGVVTD
jgi:Zn-dependent protease